MSYSISEIAKMLNVSAYTIRYYDKEGLFPLVKRVNGIRVFEDKDFPWLQKEYLKIDYAFQRFQVYSICIKTLKPR